MFAVGDVVKNTGKTFNKMYPNATGVVLMVMPEKNGVFLRIEWTVEDEKGYRTFTENHAAARMIQEIP